MILKSFGGGWWKMALQVAEKHV